MPRIKKMSLVEKGELERLRQAQVRDYSPALAALVRLEDGMQRAMERVDLGADGKMALMSVLLNDFKRIKSNYGIGPADIPQSNPNPEPPAAAISEPLPHPDPVLPVAPPKSPKKDSVGPAVNPESAVDVNWDQYYLAPKYKLKYEKLLRLLDKHSDLIKTNSKDELVLNGKPIPGSSLKDLIHVLYPPIKGLSRLNKTGYSELILALRKIHVGKQHISSARVIKDLVELKEGSGESIINSSVSPMHSLPSTHVRSKPLKRNLFRMPRPPGRPIKILKLY